MCQARIDGGKIKTFERYDTWDFEECPENFSPIDDPNVYDLNDVDEEAIVSLGIPKSELVAYAKEKYGVDISKYKKISTVAEKFCDARYRFTDALEREKIKAQ